MKLRIQGNSIRFRLLRSEVTKFIEEGWIAETVRFSGEKRAFFTYALRWEAGATHVEVRYEPSEATVILPEIEALAWAQTEQVGIYSAVNIGNYGDLVVTIEKDFACLDLSDAENQDTFPNPQLDAAC
jgi:hypothetical protein